MNHKVKELFNTLYANEEKVQSLEEMEEARINRANKPRGRTAGCMPNVYFDVASINDFTHFIDCEVSPTICPMQWEDLEINFSSIDKRYCKYCDKFVYKVDNEFMIQKMQDENKCMAISNSLLEKMNGIIDEDKYINLQDRLSISMLFLVYKDTHQEEFKEFIDNDLTQELILKAIILDILNSYNMKQTIEWYAKNGVDLEIILHQVLSNINDNEFKIQVEEKIEKLIHKGNK